ncbi:lipid A-modifier LpxR family protein [Brevundimonas variabilis]|uniref:DUF2219 domain-containing protein n=1 Tax=Brevundimonas variabilis TaxID=74312 RepID=A0A7W9CKL4_9CAUL|nr:lipid A-modifier LpxR family protein [Brevundimonas variabilis]MBB5747352.1 hypothetical protein [Brevundimonas variabilis]
MLGALASPASAQVWIDDAEPPAARATARLNQQDTLQIDPARAFGPAISLDAVRDLPSDRSQAWAVSTRRDVWHEGTTFTDRLSLTTRGELRRADGSPLPVTPLDAAALDMADYDVRFVRGWPVARGYTASGLEVSLTPHAGIGVGSRGGSAEAGATLRIGGDLGKVVPEGSEAFGERARWYVYAAGSGTAVGYNFARNRDGDFARSGVSRDSGSFLGDASIGVALRKGDMQGSFGVVYREIEAEGLRGGEGFDRDVAEGLVAFQLSIKPEW